MIKKNMKLVIGTVLFSTVAFGQGQAPRNNNGERPSGPPSTEKIFQDLDSDKDDKISLKEAKGPLQKDFSKIDTNEDGFITKEELEKAPKPKRRE